MAPVTAEQWQPACMSVEELQVWRDSGPTIQRAARPCVDCPPTWAAARLAEGHCNGNPEEEDDNDVSE